MPGSIVREYNLTSATAVLESLCRYVLLLLALCTGIDMPSTDSEL